MKGHLCVECGEWLLFENIKLGRAIKSWCLRCNKPRYFIEREISLPNILVGEV